MNHANAADADEEHDVSDHPHPPQRLDPRLLQELRAPRVPEAGLDARVRLREPDRQQAEHDHQPEADVHAPERDGERALAATRAGA